MEAFSIACTTCQSRLRVRDARMIGQILPCPKCRSMVLIERPSQPPMAPPDRGSVRPVLKTSQPAQHVLPSDSFDHIDGLFDEPIRVQNQPLRGTSRWRVAADSARLAASDARVTPLASSIAAAVGTGSLGTDLANPPVEDQADLSQVAPTVKSYWLMGGGCVVGIAMAVGIAGYLLSATETTVTSAPRHVVQRPPIVNQDPSETPAADPAPVPKSLLAVEPTSADVAIGNGSDDATPLAGQPDGPGGELAPAAGEPAVPVGEVPPPPAPESTDVPVPSPAENEVTKSVPPTDDELANFARWLQTSTTGQSASSSENDGPPPVPVPPEDAPTEAAGEIVEQPLQPTRTPPTPIDVESRLREPVSGLQLTRVPLIQAVRFLTELSAIPMRLDPGSIGCRNIAGDRPVDVLVRDATLADVLGQVLQGTGLAYSVSDGQLEIRTPAEIAGKLGVVRHDLGDFTPDDQRKFVDWVTQLIERGSWAGQGGGDESIEGPQGTCRLEDGRLIVEHTDAVQFQVLCLCERLRLARGAAPKTRILTERIVLGARFENFAHFDDAITIRQVAPSSLLSLVGQIEDQTAALILLDWPALHQMGWSPRDRLQFFSEHEPLRDVLQRLSRDTGLAVRVVDARTLEISSVERVAAQHDVEVYRLPAQFEPSSLQELGRRLAERIGANQFAPLGNGAIGYDATTNSMLISLPQPAQILANQVITEWVAER